MHFAPFAKAFCKDMLATCGLVRIVSLCLILQARIQPRRTLDPPPEPAGSPKIEQRGSNVLNNETLAGPSTERCQNVATLHCF